MPTDIDDGRRAVARFLDGRVHKGITHDFAPTKTKFHLAPRGGGKPVEVEIASLKALFFVHSWEGDAKRVDDNTHLTRVQRERALQHGRPSLEANCIHLGQDLHVHQIVPDLDVAAARADEVALVRLPCVAVEHAGQQRLDVVDARAERSPFPPRHDRGGRRHRTDDTS